MTWTDIVEKSQFLKHLFLGSVPSLARVVVHDLVLHRDGPSILIRMDLSNYPEDPPKKWVAAGFNTVQVALRAIEVKEWSMDGWSSQTEATMQIATTGDYLTVSIDATTFSARLLALHLMVDRVTGYYDGGRC